MKKTLLFLLVLASAHTIFAQSTLTKTQKLATTAKIWGFLKYYHPDIASGKYNWDDELFKILPKIENCNNATQLSKTYLDWIDSFGEIEEVKVKQKQKDTEYFGKNFDLSWIKDSHVFTSQLSEKLRYIEDNRHQGKKHYVSTVKRTGNIDITNEENYKDFDWQNKNLRLLTLFRYWNIIEYFFPYKYQTDTDWDEMLHNMIPKFSSPESEMDFHLAMLELVVSIDDSHAFFLSNQTKSFFGSYWTPAIFKLIDDKALVTWLYNDSLANLNDIKIGDVITKVDDREIKDVFTEKEKYISGSNIARKKYMAFNAILNGNSDSVKIEFIRDDKLDTKSVKRYPYGELNYKWENKSKSYKILDDNIGYVNMGLLEIQEVKEAMESLKDTKAIIFDIRNYPKGTLYLISRYITSSKNNFFKVTSPDLNYPGKFIWRDGRQCGDGKLRYKGKVILLVNERAQSHAEFTIMCLQAGYNVTTIGSQTSGADGNVSLFEIVGGYRTAISGIGIFYPDNTETQRKGVKIDIEIEPTIKGLKEGKDEVLEKAIQVINE